MHEGSADLLYSNEVDEMGVNRKDYSSENYLLNIGFFSFMEFSGRLSELCESNGAYYFNDSTHCRYRDLSASAKVQLPIYSKYLPKLALGVQDIGSAAAHYESKYIVASKQLFESTEALFREPDIRGSVSYTKFILIETK